MPEKIGFVGVGRMGSNMARRLKDCGYTVAAVYDSRGKVAKEMAAELGAEPCKSLARVTELSDVIITVVSDDAAMDKIFAEKGASLLKNSRGKVFINCATVSPEIHRVVEKRAHAVGAESLEASMASISGSVASSWLSSLDSGSAPATFAASSDFFIESSVRSAAPPGLESSCGSPGRASAMAPVAVCGSIAVWRLSVTRV